MACVDLNDEYQSKFVKCDFGFWNLGLEYVKSKLPSYIYDRLEAIPTPNELLREDIMVWNHVKDVFSISSAFN